MSDAELDEVILPPRHRNATFFTLPDGTKIHLPVGALSPSSVGMYVNCPRKYWFRYVLGIKSPPAVAPSQGTANHKAMEFNNLHKIKHGREVRVTDAIEVFHDEWGKIVKEIPASEWASSGKNKNSAAAEVVPAIKTYIEKVSPTIEPEAVERKFEKEWEGIRVLGFSDLLEADKVRDYKTISRQSGYLRDGAADFDLQLAIYAKAFKKNRAGFLCMVKGTGEVKQVNSLITPGRKAAAVQQIVNVARGISAQAYPLCDKSNFLCSARFCGYWYYCRGAKDGKARHP